MATKSLDTKIARILNDPGCGDFLLADAKDADMAGGMAAPGKSPEHHADEGRFRSLDDYREFIRQNVREGLVDIMLMSASTNEVLTLRERIFDSSHVTPAIRANDTTDIWLAQGGQYTQQPARPFRTAEIDHGMCGKLDCSSEERSLGADLGLYSVTYNNDIHLDAAMLEGYKAFRQEAEKKGFRHFLEVFPPNAPQAPIVNLGRFINDNIARTLAGVAGKGRPLFLKVPYQGPAAMEQLVAYDRHLVVGILGGSSGTTFDAFHQLWEAKKYGARVALYGRMINNSEHQSSFIRHLRLLADGEIDEPAEAVRSYHATLAKLKIMPYRSLEDDLVSTLRQSAYGSKSGTPASKHTSNVKSARQFASSSDKTTADEETPDFSKMSQQEKLQWNRQRLDRTLGT
ncbi:MAG: hypothetical protein VXZ84_06630 [Planctomycetota bacterium]|nr:hypothetical protein [Planctomycetota bacterium]